ncbi:hypothetical protein ACTVZO_00960 [Streptomyces sp. IBSNAI002]|uniref:hypothetical protein n=1 Tax=Streptomyces sp. IBSNAI002 TaxID=3457500 RepID=UPI003FD2A2F8
MVPQPSRRFDTSRPARERDGFRPWSWTEAQDYAFSPLLRALRLQMVITGVAEARSSVERELDLVASKVLSVPRSERWREAVSTAVIGDWSRPLYRNVDRRKQANERLAALRAEARVLHRQLVPLWRRGTRHGRVLSLDAELGDGLSLYHLVATDLDLLGRVQSDQVFEDERLNVVLRGLDPAERQVLFAYADGEGATWTESAAVAGACDPVAFGERVRRKARRLAAEQQRRHHASGGRWNPARTMAARTPALSSTSRKRARQEREPVTNDLAPGES